MSHLNACPMQGNDKGREVSSIPNADGKLWVYPSEAQFRQALQRKGTTDVDVKPIVPMHNTINELSWKLIKDWELVQNNSDPKLISFLGKSTDFTIKALIRHHLLGYKLPFDRHDWIVKRGDSNVRYILDYYPGGDNGIFIDVRPAPTLQGIWERLKKQFVTGQGIW